MKTTRTGEASFIEIGAANAARTSDFFSSLLGWQFETQGGGFSSASAGVGIGVHGDDPDLNMRVYFVVEDLDQAMARVRELGGKAETQGPGDPVFGRFADCRDPDGVQFGLRQVPAK
jgi:predicted enzyme related to lactoylglutathione lyase